MILSIGKKLRLDQKTVDHLDIGSDVKKQIFSISLIFSDLQAILVIFLFFTSFGAC